MWNNKNVWIILSGEMVAGMGMWLGIIGNLEFLKQLVPSDFHKSLILMIGILAGVLVGPYAGKVIDASSKKRVMINACMGFVVSFCFMFFALAYDAIAWMILFAVTFQISAAFYFPALQSVIPMIVTEKELLKLNGIHMNIGTTSRILGTALAGIMVASVDLVWMYAGSILAYMGLLISVMYLSVSETPVAAGQSKEDRQKSSFHEVFRILTAHASPFKVLLLTVIPLLFIGGFNLMVLNISEMHKNPAVSGWLYSVEGICFILGALLVKWISSSERPLMMLYVSAGCITLSHLSLFFSDQLLFALFSFGLFGIGAGSFFPMASTIFQTEIPKEYHGRFFSFRNMMDRVLFQVILLATGFLLDLIGLPFMVLVFGTISLTVLLFVMIRPEAARNPRVLSR